ncbi:chromate transporter [Thioalkalivibrio sp. HK1]|uniref:chromate transporter n=1 Tax=Thioalkalivibrio sp. HK1 TaxID=1469245 RepID=UPI0004B6DC82|nr:chromate transporter [Thioalkalivibrio sp. HK1]
MSSPPAPFAPSSPAPSLARSALGVPGSSPSMRGAYSWLVLFALPLIALPILASRFANPEIELADALYRTGSLVFGGGHVVLPLLQSEVVATGKVDHDTFLAGYGLVQALPGPLFSFAAFLGASVDGLEGRPVGALIALVAIFAPSFSLLFGVLPSWERLREKRKVRAALAGVNAAVVGLLLAVLCNPIIIESVGDPMDGLGVLLAFALLYWRRWPPWSVVGLFASGGALLSLMPVGI